MKKHSCRGLTDLRANGIHSLVPAAPGVREVHHRVGQVKGRDCVEPEVAVHDLVPQARQLHQVGGRDLGVE